VIQHSALDSGLLHKTFHEVLASDPALGEAFPQARLIANLDEVRLDVAGIKSDAFGKALGAGVVEPRQDGIMNHTKESCIRRARQCIYDAKHAHANGWHALAQAFLRQARRWLINVRFANHE